MESLMQTLVFPLTNRSVRQVFDYDTGTASIRFMYDSGARVPVWCSDVDFFRMAFPNAVKSGIKARITGFGTGGEMAEVFFVPKFELSKGEGEIVIERLPVVVLFKPQIGCDFIISETMVSKMDTFTFRYNKKELHMVTYKNKYICTSKRNNNELIDVSVWTQD